MHTSKHTAAIARENTAPAVRVSRSEGGTHWTVQIDMRMWTPKPWQSFQETGPSSPGAPETFDPVTTGEEAIDVSLPNVFGVLPVASVTLMATCNESLTE